MAINIFLTRDGNLDAADQAAFAALTQRLANRQAKVLLHLHGGLVNQTLGRATAQRLAGPVPEGFGLGPDWEQIYVVWRTGPLETLKTNWPDLFENDRIYNAVLKKLIGFVSTKLGVPGGAGRSVSSAVDLTPAEITDRLSKRPSGDPFADVNVAIERDKPTGRGPSVLSQSDAALTAEFTLALQLDPEFSAATEDVAAHLTFDPVQGRSLTLRGNPIRGRAAFDRLDARIRTKLLGTVPTTAAGRAAFSIFEVAKFLIEHAAAVMIRIINRFREKRDHGFYATVVEELVREIYGDIIGAAIWGMMKKDASDHFGPGGFGTALLAALAAAPPPRFAVTAHSAGAIWASALVKAMGSLPNVPPVRLAFLAPAVRQDFFADAIRADAARQGGSAIAEFRTFAMSDDLERHDPVLGANFGFIYPSSLLYLVAGVFEDDGAAAFPDAPLLGMQRFHGGVPAWLTDPNRVKAILEAIQFLTAQNRKIVYSAVDGGPGLSSLAKSHGAFDDEEKTLASVVAFIS